MAIRVSLIEDNAPFAKTLQKCLEASASNITCQALYPTAEAALADLPQHPPDLAIVDLNLPGMSGIEFIARLKTQCPNVLSLVLTTYEESSLIFDALKAGACGYLLKRTPPSELISAIVQATEGGSPMSPQIARQVVNFFHKAPRNEKLECLTERELSVLDHLAQGAMYKEIADRLQISIDTVRTHLRKIYEKLHVHSRTEAVLKYLGR
jgi:DNA-binding NarL/FixJ family response regulator